jgi:hypothetical protein
MLYVRSQWNTEFLLKMPVGLLFIVFFTSEPRHVRVSLVSTCREMRCGNGVLVRASILLCSR